MSPYGEISRPSSSNVILKPQIYKIQATNPRISLSSTKGTAQKFLSIIPLQNKSYSVFPNGGEKVWTHLSNLFDRIIIDGKTYPQKSPIGLDGFKSYFLSHDFFLGVLLNEEQVTNLAPDSRLIDQGPIEFSRSEEILENLSDGSKNDLIVGMYYIKPNYPGRSSHVCNAGFVVDPNHRGCSFGKTLARSYLHYAPKIGYRASVFNLVYSNNLSSIAIWDSLGFERVGLIPEAGRLKRFSTKKDSPNVEGVEEEYVDAIVYWKSFL